MPTIAVADGAVGMTGYTRAVVKIASPTASNEIEFPITFVPEVLMGVTADQPGCFYKDASTGKYYLKFTSAPSTEVVAIIGGVLGRRDMPNENPQGNPSARF